MSKDCPACGDEAATPAARLSPVRYRIENMDCPTEEALIRDKLRQLPGVTGLEFNLLQRTLTVHHELPVLASLEQALAAIDMHAVPVDTPSTDVETSMRVGNRSNACVYVNGRCSASTRMYLPSGDGVEPK